MYKSAHFTETNTQAIINFLKANSFAIITGFGATYPESTQIPLEIEEKNGKIYFSGHLMKKTDHHKAFEENENVLVLFTGPHCYVSASWYNNPQSASTWNYMTVHAKGKIKFTDEEGTYNIIKVLTEKYENAESIAAFNKIPKEYIMQHIKAIVGFNIEVDSLENVFKLSQNKTEAEKINIISKLRERNCTDDDIQIANEIEKRLN
ncbi:MAG: FMN-binding negative transcriptional regulator [Ferruginibacter sp.]|nr:FMN-binding negative transcriptional regulator [Ferruginibacter sp.]